MTIRALTDADIDAYREIRLRALAADPAAFSSTHAREAGFDDATWRARIAGFDDRVGQIFVSERDGETAGVVGVGDSPEPSDCVVWGMWVDPGHRGDGLGRVLLDAAVGWARQRGAATVTLWVMRTNATAKNLYERYGFVEQPFGRDDAPAGCTGEPCLRLTLSES
ncbi:MAG: GNAT family N-acetyltransferase [Ilumatobacter sp.]|nr:GNAT family N-acetyltransferase [Ilumatobacter sp.]